MVYEHVPSVNDLDSALKDAYQFDFDSRPASKVVADPQVLEACSGADSSGDILVSRTPSPVWLATYFPWRKAEDDDEDRQLRVVSLLLQRSPRQSAVLFAGRLPLFNAVMHGLSPEIALEVLNAFPQAARTCPTRELVPLLRQRQRRNLSAQKLQRLVKSQSDLVVLWVQQRIRAVREQARTSSSTREPGRSRYVFVAPCVFAEDLKELFRLVLEEPISQAVEKDIVRARKRQEALSDRLKERESVVGNGPASRHVISSSKIVPFTEKNDKSIQSSSTRRMADTSSAFVSPKVIESLENVARTFLGEEVDFAASIREEVGAHHFQKTKNNPLLCWLLLVVDQCKASGLTCVFVVGDCLTCRGRRCCMAD